MSGKDVLGNCIEFLATQSPSITHDVHHNMPSPRSASARFAVLISQNSRRIRGCSLYRNHFQHVSAFQRDCTSAALDILTFELFLIQMSA